MDEVTITAIDTAIIVPIITVMKTSSDTNKRKEKRDVQIALMEKRIADVELKCDGIRIQCNGYDK